MSDQPTGDRPSGDRPSRIRRPRATTAGRPRRPGGTSDAGPAERRRTAAQPGIPDQPGVAGQPGGEGAPAGGTPTEGVEARLSAVPTPAPVAGSTAPARGDAKGPRQPAGSPEALEIRMGGIGRSDAEDVAVTFGGVGLARARHVSVELGAIGLGLGEEVRLSQAAAGTVIGGTVDLEQCVARVVMGGRVTFRRASGALLVIAARTDGEVRTLLDWRGALAFGAAAGVAVGLLRRRR